MTTQTVHFKGDLAQFGETFTVGVERPADIFRLLDCQISGFRQYLIKAFEAGLDLAIISKDDILIEEPVEVILENKKPTEYYISLIPAGSGWLGKILGAILFAVAAYLTAGVSTFAAQVFAAVAINLALQAIVELLTKPPKTDEEEEGPGIFDGPENTIKSGQPVPILYGKLLVGGAPIHVDLTTINSVRRKWANTTVYAHGGTAAGSAQPGSSAGTSGSTHSRGPQGVRRNNLRRDADA